MLFNLVKIVSKVLLTNKKARDFTFNKLNKAYVKSRPHIIKKQKIFKDTYKETSPLDDPLKFIKKLKKNLNKD